MAIVISKADPAYDEAFLAGASVAFGVFDGVHEGHRFIIGEAANTAREEGSRSAVITFDIDPDEIFAPDRLKKLMSNEARIVKLAELDVDAVVVLPFSREFAAQSPEAFLDACFGGGVPSHIHIGSDFHFGRRAAGNVESLRAWGAERGMTVHGHELLAEGGVPVTATRIRGLLGEGKVREADDLLGRPYALSGTVRPGRGEGADFGFATANLEVEPLMLAIGEGVYAAYALVEGVRYKAAVNVGVPATFADASTANIEVHILDFARDIYGQPIEVEFVEWLRPMRAFDSTDELIATVMGNIAWVRENL
ncbi:riboflavin biosynthesis protein RibF [Adlercreutzia sp. R21]|uniref:Riboflavin biosynthesis protein n=1 Tax=Adlercreutzia wanghongyangiae TaxID=3111451 RepID=A0ABU6IHE1_9ACTN|nr:riboflavin biosynthesis protein RibF [Adlercreutzia sp. R21]MEC4175840.1 riboflavin biosynthesis protein RibF [Adlercreutzia sp. R7]MEC4183211.1 riboflavin biosynthesis protein RibF [Adlercreutzia sp. R21]